jgi:dienelactone hydrolase
MRALLRVVMRFLILPAVLLLAASLLWLRWDAGRPLDDYFAERQGSLVGDQVIDTSPGNGQSSALVRITSTSGLQVRIRVIRDTGQDGALPVMIVLGGHRTGSDAVDLFGEVSGRAVVAMDYPYDGPEKVRGFRQTLSALPLARRAMIDTPPAVTLIVDWLLTQPWADPSNIAIIGASLGVPFAALAAANDERISAALLVHGAADNLRWIETQIARRNDSKLLLRPAATLVWWLAHGPTFDTAGNVARIAPRPVLVIGARQDERTQAWQTEALFGAAGEPKRLRWTDGQHIEPDRADIVQALLTIADEERPFLRGPQ